MCPTPQSMREVVQFLIAKQSNAIAELQELRFAIHKIFDYLAELDRIAQALADDVERVRQSSVAPIPIVLAVHERVTLVSTRAAHSLAAFRELDRGLNGWEVGGGSPPQSNGSPLN